MAGYSRHSGIVAPLLLNNVDTDQIIPSREMKRVSKLGLADGLFSGQRYLYDGLTKIGPNPDFILNQSPFERATVLLSGKNFGCGSSREHAVWAILEYGFKAVIAESFGEIFRNNCIRNGIAPIQLTASQIDQIIEQTQGQPESELVSVNLEESVVETPKGERFNFVLEDYALQMLLNGWDFIDLTLRNQEEIDRFILQDREARSWAYL